MKELMRSIGNLLIESRKGRSFGKVTVQLARASMALLATGSVLALIAVALRLLR